MSRFPGNPVSADLKVRRSTTSGPLNVPWNPLSGQLLDPAADLFML